MTGTKNRKRYTSVAVFNRGPDLDADIKYFCNQFNLEAGDWSDSIEFANKWKIEQFDPLTQIMVKLRQKEVKTYE